MLNGRVGDGAGDSVERGLNNSERDERIVSLVQCS